MVFAEYATVGYLAKRIQMRMNRFLALQKIVEQKNTEQKKFVNGGPDGGQAPKQAVSCITLMETVVLNMSYTSIFMKFCSHDYFCYN